MNTVLFDLDGTLLPLDQDEFVRSYFELIGKKFSSPPYSFDEKKIVQGVMSGTKAMVKNTGESTNEQQFWSVFSQFMGENTLKYKPDFDAFYENEFLRLKSLVGTNAYAEKCVSTLKSKGYTVVAATNPLFPRAATKARLSWAGVDYTQFDLVTTYENCRYSKPNLQYYNEVLSTLSKTAQQCLMVGNDVDEDMCTQNIGFNTYLVTDCLVNRQNKNVEEYNHGSFKDFWKMVQALPTV